MEIGEFDDVEGLLGFRNWDSSDTPGFEGMEAVIGDGCLGGLDEEGFCFEADAIVVTVGKQREKKSGERKEKDERGNSGKIEIYRKA